MKRSIFTPEELAEIAAADAEIDAHPPTQAERDESRRLDYEIRGLNGTRSQKAKRAYYEANRDKIAEAKRAYYEANRDKIAEAQRAYREANRDKIYLVGAALRRWRLAHNMNQTVLGELVGVGQRAISYWERGEVPIDFERIERECPKILEAFG